MELCNGFADLENQMSSNRLQNTLKVIYITEETKKNFRFFSPHTLYMESCNGFAELENQMSSNRVQNTLKPIYIA
jgi:hypothetical protein